MLLKSGFNTLLIFVLFFAQLAQAEIKEYVRDYDYHGTEFDTMTTSRINAIDGVKRELLEELGTYVGSVVKMHHDSLGNSYMSHDVVNITAGIVAMKVLNEKWTQPVYYVKAGMKADPDDVLTKLKAMRADLELEKSLRESYDELQRARNEVAQLKAQLAQLKLTQAAVPSASVTAPIAVPAPALVSASIPVPNPAPAPAPAPVHMPATNPAAVQLNAQVAQVELARDVAVTKSSIPPVSIAVLPTKSLVLPEAVAPISTPAEKPAATVDTDRLAVQYVKAVQDVEVEEAFQRALAARMKGDFSTLVKEMSLLAEKGYPKAQLRMGWINERGLGVTQDYKKAREWYEKALVNGEFEAISRIGWMYEHGLGVDKDYGQAASYYKRAISKDSSWGYTHMGYLYETGKGVNRNYDQAAEHYRIGMEQGNYLAMARLGFLYQQGSGVIKNLRKAAMLYEQAVEHGQPVAMTRLGQMHNLGLGGVSKDHARALALIRESVRYNLPVAYAFMGFMYENGWEVKQDYAEAKKWYEKGAGLDAPFAEFRLGMLYKDGKGVSQDKQKAMYWLERAANKGEEKSAEILARMRNGMNY